MKKPKVGCETTEGIDNAWQQLADAIRKTDWFIARERAARKK
jgi:hypothetical protein